MRGLESLSSSITSVDVRLNGGALAETGWTLEAGTGKIYGNMIRAGWQVNYPCFIDAHALRIFPSTWAKRLAFGRDPRAVAMSGHFK
jgi:hypothetical protein